MTEPSATAPLTTTTATPVQDTIERRVSHSSASSIQKGAVHDKEQQILEKELEKDEEEVEHDRKRRHELYVKFRPLILAALAALILGWWISATILKATRHRWCGPFPIACRQHLTSSLPLTGLSRHSLLGLSYCAYTCLTDHCRSEADIKLHCEASLLSASFLTELFRSPFQQCGHRSCRNLGIVCLTTFVLPSDGYVCWPLSSARHLDSSSPV